MRLRSSTVSSQVEVLESTGLVTCPEARPGASRHGNGHMETGCCARSGYEGLVGVALGLLA